jgi:hypothetical protein
MAHTSHKQQFAAKRGVASPRLVRMLGADARMSSNDEPEPIYRGPLPEVSESDWAEFDRLRNVNKGERLARVNDQHAATLDQQWLDAMRRDGAL